MQNWISPKEALKILRKKLYVSELGFWNWLNSPHSKGIVTPRLEKHNTLNWHKFKRSEIIRLRDMLPKEKRLGLPVFPRKKK